MLNEAAMSGQANFQSTIPWRVDRKTTPSRTTRTERCSLHSHRVEGLHLMRIEHLLLRSEWIYRDARKPRDIRHYRSPFWCSRNAPPTLCATHSKPRRGFFEVLCRPSGRLLGRENQ